MFIDSGEEREARVEAFQRALEPARMVGGTNMGRLGQLVVETRVDVFGRGLMPNWTHRWSV